MKQSDFMFSEEFDEFMTACLSELRRGTEKDFEDYALDADCREEVVYRVECWISDTKYAAAKIEKALQKLMDGHYKKLMAEAT